MKSTNAQKSVQSNRPKNIKKRRRKNHLGRFFVIFSIAYAFFLVIYCLVIFIKIHIRTKPDIIKNAYSVEVELAEKEEDEKNPKFEGRDLVIDGEYYIPFSAIANIEKYTLARDGDIVSVIFEKSGEYAKFKIDTLKAYVNGNEIELSQNVKYIDKEIYLPLDFYETHLLGFSVEKNEENKNYLVSKNPDTDMCFLLKNPTATDNQAESGVASTTPSPLNFLLDLSSYEKYMNPENRDEYLFLVNSENPLDENYIPEDLTGTVYTRDDGRATQKLRKYACLALEAFLKEAEAHGYDDITVTSGYRSYEYQSQLFQNEIAITGSEEAAAKNVNPPGSSEHQSGLCVDMHNLSAASVTFGGTDEANWLEDNAYKFGYVLRYPKNKVSITGISYEPWHFRYIGRYHATKMHELGMCLEEYIEYINK